MAENTNICSIAFIGAGIMGGPMVRNLMKAGFSLRLWGRHPEKLRPLEEAGAALYPAMKDAVEGADCVVTMLSRPADVEQVWMGPGGLLSMARHGTLLIDMTTSAPELAKKLAFEGAKRGCAVLDAPVSGGEKGAVAGTLSIFVGGSSDAFSRALPLLNAVGTQITHMGPAGCGHHAKMVNQIMVGANLSGICEGLTYARAAGLDFDRLMPALTAGTSHSKQMDKIAPKILAHDDTPSFFVSYLAKDLGIALQEAQSAELRLEVLEQVLANLHDVMEQGMGQLGTQALVHHYEKKPQ